MRKLNTACQLMAVQRHFSQLWESTQLSWLYCWKKCKIQHTHLCFYTLQKFQDICHKYDEQHTEKVRQRTPFCKEFALIKISANYELNRDSYINLLITEAMQQSPCEVVIIITQKPRSTMVDNISYDLSTWNDWLHFLCVHVHNMEMKKLVTAGPQFCWHNTERALVCDGKSNTSWLSSHICNHHLTYVCTCTHVNCTHTHQMKEMLVFCRWPANEKKRGGDLGDPCTCAWDESVKFTNNGDFLLKMVRHRSCDLQVKTRAFHSKTYKCSRSWPGAANISPTNMLIMTWLHACHMFEK